VPEAFLLMYVFEATCMIQVRAQAGGTELLRVDPRILAGAKAMANEATRSMGGNLAWPGLLRKLDRRNPGYRD
jgi:ribulose-5-phosphate 4-epimerase/fuculose-1-phosphate aldolase